MVSNICIEIKMLWFFLMFFCRQGVPASFSLDSCFCRFQTMEIDDICPRIFSHGGCSWCEPCFLPLTTLTLRIPFPWGSLMLNHSKAKCDHTMITRPLRITFKTNWSEVTSPSQHITMNWQELLNILFFTASPGIGGGHIHQVNQPNFPIISSPSPTNRHGAFHTIFTRVGWPFPKLSNRSHPLNAVSWFP